jgi:hypothetical protein
MKSKSLRWGLCLAAVVLAFPLAQKYSLAQKTSPSAVAAVRLKYHPPNNWMRHYLGDDRYKIAGNVWSVVSTQMDTYYHRADCPNMLRQQAGTTIGFANYGEAEAAGYTADPLCAPRAGRVSYAGGSGDGTTINSTRRAITIVLADGKSTVLLPPQWKRTRTGAQTVLGYTLLSDTLQPLSGKGSLRFAFINAPGNLNIEPMLTADKFSKLVELSAKNGSNRAAANYLRSAKISNGRLGGKNGVTIAPQANAPGAEVRGRVSVIANGAKVYVVENQGGAGADAVIKSFTPR